MTIVVKIGGAAIEDTVTLRKCARSVAELAQDGHRVAVVHGGGSALTRMLDRLGKKSEFVDGLRVTDALGATVSAQGVLTTNALPSVTSFASSAPNITLGHSVIFTVAATGGTGSLVIGYQGLPAGCAPTLFDRTP